MAEMLEKTEQSPVDQVDRRPKRIYKVIGDTARMNYALDHAFLVERERWLQEEKIRLKKKFTMLNREIDCEIAQVREEQDRLMSGIRYSLIAEEIPDLPIDAAQRASAPTGIIVSEE
jgi:hypothetical protein